MSFPTSTAGPALSTEYIRRLGGPAQLAVSWTWENARSVRVQLHALNTTPAYLIHACHLSMHSVPVCRFRMPARIIGPQERHVEFLLEYDAAGVLQLHASIPFDTDKWFSDVLSPDEPPEPTPSPDPDGPDDPDSPPWSPFYDPDQAYGFSLVNPRQRYRIFDFLWLRGIAAAGADEPSFLETRQVSTATSYPLLTALADERDKAATPHDAWVTLAKTAAAYMQGSSKAKTENAFPYLKSLAELDPEWRALSALRLRLLRIEGETTREVLDAVVAEQGAIPPRYAESKAFRTQWVRVWQSLVALALCDGDGEYAAALRDLLRAAWFLFDLQAGDVDLSQPRARLERLEGVAVIPVCAVPPRGALPMPTGGLVRLLGVGELQAIYKEGERYVPGPLSRTFNVLRGERRRLRTIEESLDLEQTDNASARDLSASAGERTTQASDLEEALRATIESGCNERDFNNLSVVYNDIYMPQSISGDWTDTAADQLREQSRAARLAREITRRAARRVAESVQSVRRAIHAQRREHTVVRDIDNRAAPQHLNGLYRWLIRRSRLSLQDEGRRLVVECIVAHPGAKLANQADLPAGVAVTPPPTLADLKIQAPADVKPDNYLGLAATFGLLQPPEPPEPQRGFSVRLTGQAAQASACLRLPDGYLPVTTGASNAATAKATLSYVSSDKSQALVCSVGAYTAVYGGTPPAPAAPPAARADLAVVADPPAPPCSCNMIDPFKQQPMPPPVPGTGSDAAVTIDPAATEIPILVYSGATFYAVSVTVQAQDSAYAEKLQRWQQALYAQLLAACIEQRRRYAQERKERLQQCLGASQRATLVAELKRQALDLLAALHCSPSGTPPPATPALLSMLDVAFQWRQMAYAFLPWAPDQPSTATAPSWHGLDSATHADAALGEAFLSAGSARVLIPVMPGHELALLYYLSYGAPWRLGDGDALLPAPWLAAAAELARPRSPRRRCWWIEEPTALEILQQDEYLPRVVFQPDQLRPGCDVTQPEPAP